MRYSLAFALVFVLNYAAFADDAKAAYIRGVEWFEKMKYEKAIAEYTEAIRLDPKFARAFHGLGETRAKKKEYDKAIEDFTEAARLDPDYTWSFSMRGDMWFVKREYDKAIRDYSEAIRIDAKNVPALCSRGTSYCKKKEFAKAIADYDACLKLDPKDAFPAGGKGFALMKLRKPKEAIAEFERAIEIDPLDWFHRELAYLYATYPDAKYRDGKKAVELAKAAINKAGKDADWEDFATLATAYAEVGHFDHAITEQQKAIDDKRIHPIEKKAMEARMELYRTKKPYRDVNE